MSDRLDVLCVGATAGELEALARALDARPAAGAEPGAWREGRREGLRVGVLATGVGKANAALALGAALAPMAARPGLLLAVGVGGAYPSAGLRVGDLAVATEECYGDEGVAGPQGLLPLDEIGIPLWEEGPSRYFNRFPADPGTARGLARAASAVAGCRVGVGPFVTVSSVTGTREGAEALERRFGGVCESMEGAALAHAAAAYRLPFAEVRGISNPVGPRDRAAWRLEEAAAAAQAAALGFLDALARAGT